CFTLLGSVVVNMAIGIIIPIALTQVGVLLSFLPLIVRSELPLMFSIPYFYANKMNAAWIIKNYDIFGVQTMAAMLPWDITTIPIDPYVAMLILAIVCLICLFLTQIYVQRKDLT
ncbi:MAG: hypothetical protein ACXQS8_06965, partial [Candidatus Helarchaeales archaeon]